jgi:hypothetical protein
MDGIVAEIIRLQAMGHEDAADLVPAVTKKLRDQAAQLKVFEREIAEF